MFYTGMCCRCCRPCSLRPCVIIPWIWLQPGYAFLLTQRDTELHLPSHCPYDHLGGVGTVCGEAGKDDEGSDAPIVMTDELIVTAFPNPYNTEVHLKVQSFDLNNVDVKVYDVTGSGAGCYAEPADNFRYCSWPEFSCRNLYCRSNSGRYEVRKVKVVKYYVREFGYK